MKPENVGVVEVPKENLATGAMVTDFDLSKGNFLNEVRVYGDVAIRTEDAIPVPQTGQPFQAVMYHGTLRSNQDAILRSGLALAPGTEDIWLTDSPKNAAGYAEGRYLDRGEGTVFAATVTLDNPFVIDRTGPGGRERYLWEMLPPEIEHGETFWGDKLFEMGYDAIVYRGRGGNEGVSGIVTDVEVRDPAKVTGVGLASDLALAARTEGVGEPTRNRRAVEWRPSLPMLAHQVVPTDWQVEHGYAEIVPNVGFRAKPYHFGPGGRVEKDARRMLHHYLTGDSELPKGKGSKAILDEEQREAAARWRQKMIEDGWTFEPVHEVTLPGRAFNLLQEAPPRLQTLRDGAVEQKAGQGTRHRLRAPESDLDALQGWYTQFARDHLHGDRRSDARAASDAVTIMRRDIGAPDAVYSDGITNPATLVDHGFREVEPVPGPDVGIHSTGGYGPSETLRDQYESSGTGRIRLGLLLRLGAGAAQQFVHR